MTLPAIVAVVVISLMLNHPNSKPRIHFLQYSLYEPENLMPQFERSRTEDEKNFRRTDIGYADHGRSSLVSGFESGQVRNHGPG